MTIRGAAQQRCEQALYRAISANNDRVHRVDPIRANPRPIEDLAWYRRLQSAHPSMQREWRHFRAAGLRLPQMEQMIPPERCASGEPGPYWEVGGLLSLNGPVDPVARWFPRTVAALQDVPGMQSAVLSVMGPGKDLGAHEGPNAGGLRLLFGVDCGEGAALEIGGRTIAYEDGVGVLFDDTETHSAWNRGADERVVLMCDVLRPLPSMSNVVNRSLQYLHHMLIPDFRLAHLRVAEWHAALNPDAPSPATARQAQSADWS